MDEWVISTLHIAFAGLVCLSALYLVHVASWLSTHPEWRGHDQE